MGLNVEVFMMGIVKWLFGTLLVVAVGMFIINRVAVLKSIVNP
jgi:hypothetical protein